MQTPDLALMEHYVYFSLLHIFPKYNMYDRLIYISHFLRMQ